MGRTNKVTSGVFSELVGNSKKISSYDEFINNQISDEVIDELKNSYLHSQDLDKEYVKYTEEYKSLINKTKTTFFKLSKLEEVLLQMRSLIGLNNDNIKLSVVREYIYARTPFYRSDKDAKDIRIINGLTEFYGDDMDNLIGNKEFMSKAKDKLSDAMVTEIRNNINEYKKISK